MKCLVEILDVVISYTFADGTSLSNNKILKNGYYYKWLNGNEGGRGNGGAGWYGRPGFITSLKNILLFLYMVHSIEMHISRDFLVLN